MKFIHTKIVTIKPMIQTTEYSIGVHILANLHRLDAIRKPMYSSYLLLMDKREEALFGKTIYNSLQRTGKNIIVSIIDEGEAVKDIRTIASTIQPFFRQGFDRHALIIGVGGGVITDIAGFLGAILLRGIDTCFIPTTLLGQIDASIGGKNGVNIRMDQTSILKNMIGTVHQPKTVITDVAALKTLPQREILSGLGEMVKYWIGWNKPSIATVQETRHLQTMDSARLIETIKTCQDIKLGVITKDPFEQKGLRDSLNLGHTIGHAIEGTRGGKLSHGQAVAIGLVACSKISMKVGLLSSEKCSLIIQSIAGLGLPILVSGIKKESISQKLKMDKKGGTFVLLEDIGKIRTRQIVHQSIIEETLEEIIV